MHRVFRIGWRTGWRTGWVAALALLAAAPGSAAVFAVHLTNGAVFESRYRPLDAFYDAGKVILLDEVGNSVAISKADIARIETDVEVSGYGHVLDDTTIALGWAPNDAPLDGTPEAVARAQAQDAANAGPRGPAAEPIYDAENIPATMMVIPSFTSEGQPYVIPAPTAPTAVEPPG